MTLTVTTVNLNGIRAAHKRGFLDWLEASDTDVLLMQEVRAPEEISREIMGEAWESVWVPCRIKGRAGVGVAVRRGRAVMEGEPRLILDDAETDVDSGRWLEAVVRPEGGGTPVRVVSAYFHSGEKDTPKQEAKMAHLPRIGVRMAELLAEEAAGGISTSFARRPTSRTGSRTTTSARASSTRRSPSSTSGWRRGGAIPCATWPAMCRAPTRGGHGAVRPSSTTRAGASTISTRRPPWVSARVPSRSAAPTSTRSASRITRRSP